MLNVGDVLELPVFGQARVVAGKAGLARRVLWVHNAGVPDAPEWLNGGELVLTTIINMPQTPEEQVRYVRDMVAKDVAGLVITTGRYIERIPDHICEAAEECHFPLIEIPYQARFVDMARAVNERISQQNMALVERAMGINQALTRLVLDGGSFHQLAAQLAEFVGHSISIENERFEAIATVNLGEVDEARRYTQQYGRTDARLVDALEKRGYLPRIRSSLRPVQLPPMPDVGLEMERILAPVVVHGEIYGFMWIIADTHSISDIDMMALESGATIAALMTLYQESIHNAEASLKGGMLSQLIQGDNTRETILTDQSLRYGVDLRSPYRMMLIACERNSSQRQIYRSINQLIATDAWQAIVGQFAGELIVLAQHNDMLETMAGRVYDRIVQGKLCGENAALRIGISAVHQGSQTVRSAHQECQDVLQIMQRLQPDQHLLYFSELGYLHTLYHAGPNSLLNNPYVPVLRRLMTEKQTDLLHTLEAYLDAGGNGVATAEMLHIHRSTLNYRLDRIVQICEISLNDPAMRMNLQVAIKLMRMFETDTD